MEERTLRVLEFTKIREQLVQNAVSEMGQARCAELVPSNDFAEIQTWQQETEEAVTLLNYLPNHPLIPVSDVRPYLRMTVIGATLSPRALLDIAASMRAARAARDVLVTDRENTPHITGLASELGTFRHLEEEISAAILSEDEIADHASPELYDIRRHIRLCNDKVREKLNSLIRNPNFQKHLQDPIITIRNDRFVIPVKQESRGSVPGLIHDQSTSGATLFIEPMAVVEINNDLKQWVAKEKNEIERILNAFSARIAPDADALGHNLSVLAELDFIFAKGKLSRQMYAAMPKINRDGYLKIQRGRHPLIDPKQVVPINLWMGREFTTLVITGPNTGGKTVTLKTIGLFTLMMQAGLQVPADLGTELSVFDQVFADIGDEQSIEQSLSTFSSHMRNIVHIMEEVTDRSLALFDELGAGTDPTEGAALAQAVLRSLLARKIRTLATTHYSELKAFALTTEGVENASAEFDVETLRPTYRLSIGVPGKSNAFEISSRLGLTDDLIQVARELLTQDAIRFEDVIANAEYHRRVAERERELAEEARVDMTRMRNEAEALKQKLDEQRDTQMRKSREEARRVLESAKQEADEILSSLRKMKREGGSFEQEATRMQQKLREGVEGLSDQLSTPVFTAAAPPRNLKPGDTVQIVHLNTKGTVLSGPDAKGDVQIQAGVMKLKAHISQLKLMEETPKERNVRAKSHIDMTVRQVRREIDLRGMALDEALQEVDKFLDDAMLSSLGEVCIIHGKGTGALRSGITTHLRRHPHVQTSRLGKYGEGEDGVTVVQLK